MSVDVRPPEGESAKRLNAIINGVATGVARHWLAIFNLVVAVFVALPFLAPVLMQAGATGPAELIYKIYSPACHQLPERSVFLYGHDHFYSVDELEAAGYLPANLNQLQRMTLRWAGAAEAGWKIAICQRDIAIYVSVLLSGLLFAVVRPRFSKSDKLPKMPVWLLILLLAPVALDGLSQLPGWRESIPALRFLTGAIAGAAVVWFAYPHVEDAMRDVARGAEGSDA